MTDITSAIKQQQSVVDSLGQQLKKIARQNPIAALGMPEEYYKVLRQYQQAKKTLNELMNKRSKIENEKRVSSPTSKKKFINSFGEATERKITSSAYERAMKRQEKEILQFLGK